LCNAPILSLPDGAEDFMELKRSQSPLARYDLVCSRAGLDHVSHDVYALFDHFKERNWRLFKKSKRSVKQVVDCIASTVRLKLLSCRFRRSKDGMHYACLWDLPDTIFRYPKSLQHIFDLKELNISQRRWIELFSDYDCEIHYHPGKADVVAGALSRNERVKTKRVRAVSMTIQSSLKEKLLATQNEAIKEENAPAEILCSLDQQMEKRGDGGLNFMDSIWVPLIDDVRIMIISEAHATTYSIHLIADKMYYDLRDMYWGPCMKKDIATYVSKCLTCSKVKVEHQRLLDYKMERLSRLYMDEFVSRHGVLVSIILDCDGRFTSRFWQILQKALGTRLDMSTAYHPQTDRQIKCTVQTLEDMLRACVIDFGGSWDTHLPFAEFYFNNSYHSSIQCAPFEVLYGRNCRSLVLWAVERLKATRDRQKSYADNRRKPLEFKVGDQVLLKVSHWKGVVHFENKGKLAPRYLGPFEVFERIGLVAYRLRLQQELSTIHDTFHVSNMKKCLVDANLHVPLEEIRMDKTLRKMKPKEDIDIFVPYSESSRGFHIYNRRTRKIMETIHVKFDKLTAMASECNNSGPDINCSNLQNSSKELNEIPSKEDLDNLFGPMYEQYYAIGTTKESDNFTANTLDNEDTPSSSSIIVEDHDTPQLVSSSKESITNEPTPVLDNHFDEQV
nr:putative reverse transcriptase domain-containing protein [Tanacetum cinerariifolium]